MTIRMTEEEFVELREDCGGVCRSCKARQGGCEPDARFYLCEDCGQKQVFGVEELLIMGQIELIEEQEVFQCLCCGVRICNKGFCSKECRDRANKPLKKEIED